MADYLDPRQNQLGQLGAGLYGGMDMAQQHAMTATEVMMRQQHQMDALRYQMLAQDARWFGEPETPKFKVTGGAPFVARFECKDSGDCFELSSPEKPAVERGMRHYVTKWQKAVRNLLDAGLAKDELHVALVLIKPRLVEEAIREKGLEEGVRQAETKARQLLVMCLTPEQIAEFNEKQSFTLTVDHKVSGFPTGAFRIKKGSAFNVEHIESGETFCVVSQEKVPVYDQMLTQKLLLENEPERFFKTANRSGGGMQGWQNEIINDYMRQMARQLDRELYRDIVGRPPSPVAAPPERDRDSPMRQAIREFTERHRR